MATMTKDVKRSYDTTSRQQQSAATRQRIVEAARGLMLERGYRATTIAAIAAEAGVNADSVYALVGRKPMVLRELIEQALSGTDREVVAEDRQHVKALLAEPDQVKKFAIYARAVSETHQRLAPLFLALREASSSEPEAQAVWKEISDRRAANMRKLAKDVKDAGGLRPRLSIEQAGDVIWATNSVDLFVMLTIERGWPTRRYERWLADTWCRLLLP